MSDLKIADWKSQVFDKFESFSGQALPSTTEADGILLSDIGQAHLACDALRPLFSTCDFRIDPRTSAVELGKMLGHYESLWFAMAHFAPLMEETKKANAIILSARDSIDAILLEHAPEAMNGPKTGIIHVLAEYSNPAIGVAACENMDSFQAMMKWALLLALNEGGKEYSALMSGYGAAKACCPFGDDGLLKNPDKLATLLVMFRPFVMAGNLSSSDFQEVVDHFANAPITGNFERFSKHLQRRRASVRAKGRPLKKWANLPKAKRKKSDNL